jgi:hypothetical protein
MNFVSTLKDWTYTKKGTIKKTVLKRDLERGVKFLNEMAYSNQGGCTRSSALFCLELKKHIDLSLVHRVDFKKTRGHWFTVTAYTTDGYTIQLKGFSFGYWGEGSRGSMAFLKECGFNDKQINKIFTIADNEDTHFKIRRKVAL